MASRSSSTPPPPPSLPSATKNNNHSSHRKNHNHSRHSSNASHPEEATANRRPAHESLVSRKKKEIVDRSMAIFELTLDRCLKNPVSPAALVSSVGAGLGGAAAAAGAGVRRALKRAREDEDEDDDWLHGTMQAGYPDGGKATGKSEVGVKAKKKKVNPKETDRRKFACPFSRHDPSKYKTVKTCCGPGWDDVHRVKEHVYRKHSLKNYCPRCLEHFEKPELLKAHQRADEPCAVRRERAGAAAEAITDEQEKLIRTRAKAHSSEEDKWAEMYRAIFPDERIPSPYYDSPSLPSTTTPPITTPSLPTQHQHLPSGTSAGASANASAFPSRFQTMDEWKAYLRAEIIKQVRPALVNYVEDLFNEVQERVNHKAVEIVRDIETRLVRTFEFQEEQAAAHAETYPAAAAVPNKPRRSVSGAVFQPLVPSGAPSPPPSPGQAGLGKAAGMFEGLGADSFGIELCGDIGYDLEALMVAGYGSCAGGFEGADSAYCTGSGSGSGAGSGAGEDEGFEGYCHGGY